jgi:hypothetical protein
MAADFAISVKNMTCKSKVIPVFHKAPYHEDVYGSGGIPPCNCNLSIKWRQVVGFIPRKEPSVFTG